MAEINQDLLENALSKISECEIQNVRFECNDMNGIARSKTVPARHFQDTVMSGVYFQMFLYGCDPLMQLYKEQWLFKKFSMSDTLFCPDLSTFTVLPWVKNTARVLVTPSNVDVTIDPRQIALQQLSALKKRNLSILSSFEYEFWVVDAETRQPLTDDRNIFSTLRLSTHQEFFDKLSCNLYGAGVDIEYVVSEYATGQYEMPMKPAFGIRAADNAATFRTGVKEMAMQENLIASFMAKPYEKEEGSSGHLNHSLWSEDGKTPKLSDPSRPFGLSEIGEHWIAGLLEHAPALSLLQSPTLNCRDRIKAGSPAVSINATWGVDNRSCAIRWKKRGSHGCHIEDRIGSSAGNPYISFAAMIAAGIDGIDRQLPLPKAIPTVENARDEKSIPPGTVLLPLEMEDALTALLSDEIMVAALGTYFIKSFEGLKRHEIQLLKKQTENGRDKYEWLNELYFKNI